MLVQSEKPVGIGGHWSQQDVDVGSFKDARLGRRFFDLLRRLSDGMGGSVPFACQDWSNTKAAYRFFSNPRVEEADIARSFCGDPAGPAPMTTASCCTFARLQAWPSIATTPTIEFPFEISPS
jgi:hypothetical protein